MNRDFEPNNVSVKLFRKNLIHNHENSAHQVFKVSEETKKIITDLFDNGMRYKSICYEIRGNPDIVQPRGSQIRTIIENHKKTKYGSPKVKLQDIVDFANLNSNIPDDDDTAFVVKFERSPQNTNDKFFRLFASTKN